MVATKAHDMVEVHRVLTHLSEEIAQARGSGIGNRDDGPVGVLQSALAGERETAGTAGN